MLTLNDNKNHLDLVQIILSLMYIFFLLYLSSIKLCKNLFRTTGVFYIRKDSVFQCFQGQQKEISGMNWVICVTKSMQLAVIPMNKFLLKVNNAEIGISGSSSCIIIADFTF